MLFFSSASKPRSPHPEGAGASQPASAPSALEYKVKCGVCGTEKVFRAISQDALIQDLLTSTWHKRKDGKVTCSEECRK